MGLDKTEDLAEFIRLIAELSDFAGEMDFYSANFVMDNAARLEQYGDKTSISETQLAFARKLYERYL